MVSGCDKLDYTKEYNSHALVMLISKVVTIVVIDKYSISKNYDQHVPGIFSVF